MTIQAIATHDREPAHDPRPPALLNYFRVGYWQCALALVLLVAIAFARAPMRQIPDALFVSDGFGYYIFLPSVFIDGDLDLANQLERVPYEAQKSYFDPVEKTGLRANPFPVGAALLWLPFFLAAHAGVLLLRLFGADLNVTGFGFVYELPVYCGAFLYGLAALWLVERTVAGLFSRRVAAQTLCAVLFCTPFAYYLWIEPDVSHVNAAFAVALLIYLIWRAMDRRDGRLLTWVAIGASIGLVALVRPYNGLLAAATLPAAWLVTSDRPAPLLHAAWLLGVAAVTALVVFVPQAAAATVIYGELVLLPPGTRYDEMMWTHPNIAGLAVSVFSFFPLLVAGFAGLLPWRSSVAASVRAEGACDNARQVFLQWVRPIMLLVLLAVMYITASYPRGSSFGDSFGQRRIVDWAPVVAVGMASLFALVPERWQRRFNTALVVLAAIEIVLLGLYIVKLVPQWGGTVELGVG